MNIITFSNQLQQRLSMRLADMQLEGPDLLKSSHAVTTIQHAILELKTFVTNYNFIDQTEEIKFFKEAKPIFISQLRYHQRIFAAKLFDSFNTQKERMNYYVNGLHKLQVFASRNTSFYEYCISGSNQFDELYFTRNAPGLNYSDRDPKFTTRCDGKLAKVLCNEMLKEYYHKAIQKLNSSTANNEQYLLAWTAPKTALIELIYALHAVGVFNNASVDVKFIVGALEKSFHVSLGNFYRAFHEMSIRKGSRTTFLDQLKDRLIIKLDNKDE